MGANGYSIDYKLNSSSSWIAATGSVLPTITISALPAGIYDWRVKANCAANQSNFSNEKFTITIPTNLNAQNENRYQLLLFPNPAKNTILLRFKLSTKEKNIEISLYNVIGKKLFSKMVEGAVGNNELMLDLSMYSNGQYTVSLGVKGINEIKNFVIVK